jgi:demethylspheroidene O-methyltransferase
MASVLTRMERDALLVRLPGLGPRFRAWRDRVLASPRFQVWAASLPFTRRVATRYARDLFDLCAGFVYSQVLYTCVRLDVFELLAAGPCTSADLAQRWQMPVPAAERLLAAAVALKLLERRGKAGYGLGILGAALRANPGAAAMIEHHELLYSDLRDPVALLRGEAPPTRLSRYWSYSGAASSGEAPSDLAPEQVLDYTQLMSRSQHLVARDILDAYPLQKHHCLLDIGGGNGAFAIAAARRAPQLRAIVADLPGVAVEARRNIADHGLSQRIDVHGGDAMRAELPAGADIASLVRVIHDHDDGPALELLRAACEALLPGGVLLIAEPMAATVGAEPMGDAYFGFYLLAMGSGRPRTSDELAAMARSAGFAETRVLSTRRPLLAGVLLCRKAG